MRNQKPVKQLMQRRFDNINPKAKAYMYIIIYKKVLNQKNGVNKKNKITSFFNHYI